MLGSADICTAMTAGRADHAGLEVVESDLIGQVLDVEIGVVVAIRV
jgi:hypothetical protein